MPDKCTTLIEQELKVKREEYMAMTEGCTLYSHKTVTGYNWSPVTQNTKKNHDIDAVVYVQINERRKQNCSSNPCLYHQMIRTCKVATSQHA